MTEWHLVIRFRFAFTMTESEALGMTHLQYLTSVSSLTGDNLHMADEWKAYTDTPVTINRPAGADEYYIYARINNGNGKYQEIKTYHYTFEDAAGTVTISPRTVSVESIEDTICGIHDFFQCADLFECPGRGSENPVPDQ